MPKILAARNLRFTYSLRSSHLKYWLFDPQFHSRGYALKRVNFQGGSIGTKKSGYLLSGFHK